MIENLTPRDAERLSKITSLISQLDDLMTDLCPAGGWKERIDKKYCKECGKEHDRP